MKRRIQYIVLSLLSCAAFAFPGKSQGRVVINEYMPWTLNGCGATAEFVELLNFGPGPVNIGCYTLTDGDFAVTIPPNTILLPGQFYVIAGQDVIPAPCANIDSTIRAHLNWNTCNCTSAPIPTTGDGFFTDGGSASEQVVLLSPTGQVVDAVVRDLPAEPNSTITTRSMAGCGSRTFNLDFMIFEYEVLGMSAGRGNSFARKLDGDCGWVKDPQQSANATNNTPNVQSDVTYLFSFVDAMDCTPNHGSVSIFVKKSSYEDFFPVTYTIAYDSNHDGVFGLTDQYTYHTDNTPPEVYISNLPAGRYRITLESVKGCSLKTFEFEILPCMPVLPVTLEYFRMNGAMANGQKLEWRLSGTELLKTVILEKSVNGGAFSASQQFPAAATETGTRSYSATEPADVNNTQYRLKVVMKDNRFFYSPVLSSRSSTYRLHTIGPNPATTALKLEISSMGGGKAPYAIYNTDGRRVASGSLELRTGATSHTISLLELPAGCYQLQVSPAVAGQQPISFRFVKH